MDLGQFQIKNTPNKIKSRTFAKILITKEWERKSYL